MKKTLSSMIVCVFLPLFATTVAQGQKINYRASTYVKIAPEKEAEALEFARTVGTKVVREEMSAGIPIVSFALSRVTYSGVPAMEYNYIASTTFEGAPPEPNPAVTGPIVQKVAGMSLAQYQQKLSSLGTVTGTVLSRIEAATPGAKLAEGNYFQVVRWKITPQRGADYGSYIQRMQLPLNAQAMKDGRIISWDASRTVSPGGSGAGWDATTVTYVKDLASALPSTPPAGNQGEMNFGKVFPGQNFTTFVDAGRALRQAVRTELVRAMVVVQK